MPGKRYTAEAIIHKPREADVMIGQWKTVGEVCKALGVTDRTCCSGRLIQKEEIPDLQRTGFTDFQTGGVI